MRLLAFILGLATLASASSAIQAQTAPESTNTPAALPYEGSAAAEYSRARLAEDIKAVETYRPEYQFWQYIFTIPDGRIAFGSAHSSCSAAGPATSRTSSMLIFFWPAA